MEFDIKLITPGFCRGANQQVPELRAPSIRGQLRWWFRALQSENNLSKLRQDEVNVFGNASQASPVALRCNSISRGNDFNEHDLSKYCRFGGGFDPKTRRHNKDRGIKYLANRALSNQAFLRDGFRFKISLLGPDDSKKQIYAQSLWLLLFLGGIGLRSRRGFGNLVCTHHLMTSGANSLPFKFTGKESDELVQHLRQGLYSLISSGGTTKYSSLKGATIYVLKEHFSTWRGALEKIGAEYEKFRYHRRLTSLWDGANFGFPVIKAKGTQQIIGEDCDRRASPLIFKVWANSDCTSSDRTSYWAGFVHLTGDFMPSNNLIHQRKQGGKWVKIGGPQAATSRPVNDFLNSFTSSQVSTINI